MFKKRKDIRRETLIIIKTEIGRPWPTGDSHSPSKFDEKIEYKLLKSKDRNKYQFVNMNGAVGDSLQTKRDEEKSSSFAENNIRI